MCTTLYEQRACYSVSVLDNLQDWLAQKERRIPQHDHALLVTGYVRRSTMCLSTVVFLFLICISDTIGMLIMLSISPSPPPPWAYQQYIFH